MTVFELSKKLDEIIPNTLSEEWDNDGNMVIPDRDAEVTSVLVALDCTSEAIARAKAMGANVIVTHHPLIFRPMSSLTDSDSVGKRVLDCVKSGIAVLSYHTRLDSLDGGVNDMLSDAIGIENTSAFLPYGRIGDVAECDFSDFCRRVSDSLGVELLHTVDSGKRVRRVAVVSGCGKDEISAVIKAGADTFVTGEVMHNHLIDCRELGLNLICATHRATEEVVLPKLAEIISSFGIKYGI